MFKILKVFPMSNSITQDIQYKQSVVEYSYRHGVTKAAIQFKMYRKTIYRWREKYDGIAKSLINKSRRPHSHPKEHTREEIKLIKDYKAKNKDTGLVVLWVKLNKVGYTRSITSLYRVMQRLGIYKKTPSKKKKYEPKPYEQMKYRPNALKEATKLDLEALIENDLEVEIDYQNLDKDHQILGATIFRDGYMEVYNNGNKELKKFKRNTMIFDIKLSEDYRQAGRFLFTLAHEIGHWVLHKKYFFIDEGQQSIFDYCSE